MLRIVLVLLVASWSTAALGIEPTRIERLGKACPVGYATEGGYCIPGADAEFAFHKLAQIRHHASLVIIVFRGKTGQGDLFSIL